jgi:hypothetical protein
MSWGPGATGGFQNALSTGLQLGQMVRQQKQENALMQQRQQQIDLQRRQFEADQAAAAEKAQREANERKLAQLPKVVGLLETVNDETSFQRARQIAGQEFGFDLSNVPQNYDPNWMAENLPVLKVLSDPAQKDQLDRDLDRLGFPVGSEGREGAARELILFKYGKPVTTADGRAAIEMPIISMPGQGGQQQATIENTPPPQLGANGMPAVLTREQYQAVEQSLGVAETAEWAMRNKVKVIARTGTDANGRRVIQYNDGTIEYAGN